MLQEPTPERTWLVSAVLQCASPLYNSCVICCWAVESESITNTLCPWLAVRINVQLFLSYHAMGYRDWMNDCDIEDASQHRSLGHNALEGNVGQLQFSGISPQSGARGVAQRIRWKDLRIPTTFLMFSPSCTHCWRPCECDDPAPSPQFPALAVHALH